MALLGSSLAGNLKAYDAASMEIHGNPETQGDPLCFPPAAARAAPKIRQRVRKRDEIVTDWHPQGPPWGSSDKGYCFVLVFAGLQ